MVPEISVCNRKPGIVVVEKFLNNPLEHREFALGLEYEKEGSYGVRSKQAYAYPEYREAFQSILQRQIVTWEGGVNGCYQWCDRHQDIVYHADAQQYAGIIFLTPGAPLNSGTSFWRSRNSGERVARGNSQPHTFGPRGEHLKDGSQWELVDRVGNVFNRLVLFYGKYIHSASHYFGDDIHDSRLFQVFFFNCK